MEIEFLNPYDEKTFKVYIERKLVYLNRLLNHIKKLNRKAFDVRPILDSIRSYHMGSLKQALIIKQMKAAYRRQGVPLIVKRAQEGLDAGLFPVLITHGRSGSYWMRSKEKEVLGIFKPFDEEPFAINNPARTGEYAALGKRVIRPGIAVGESAHNEVAAYLLDSFFGFGIVPHTCYACFTHHAFFLFREKKQKYPRKKKKYGSFQEYIEGFVPIPKLPREYLEQIPLDEYQTMLFFDLLTGNSDRHLNNLLIGEEKLAAIDHGLCFTDSAPDMPMIVWSSFPQSDKPFHPEIVKLAHHFPLERISWKLRKNCFRSVQSMERMRERLALFVAALDAGLVPSQMTRLLTWENFARLMNKGSYVDEIAQKIVEHYDPEPPALQRWLS